MMTTGTFCRAFLTLLALTTIASAQPQVSYIIPDIGAAGMNSYIEIIGPFAATNNFGADGFYANVPGDVVRVEPATAADAAKAVVGPLVVSWSGRMISTQIFVKPGVGNGTIGLRITANGQSRVENSFTVVTPTPAMNLTAGGALGSGGAFGTRSPRGAMIVESLTLGGPTGTVYTVSSSGLQGYLPFILISKGPITILSTASLNANGGTTDAAPGGGGGAGRVCDANLFGGSPNGNNGGSGYTGGGAGGRNAAGTTASGGYLSPGTSTGTAGSSMNGAPGGLDARAGCPNPEASGGGTGHPFGRGGSGACPGPGQPGYGGGSGNVNQVAGGGAGYGTAGANGGGATQANLGLAHGNDQVVPVAGGSGGGGGNPQGFGKCAGGGGGGGGAIAIYSHGLLLNSGGVNARGGNGENSSGSGAGGGGAGSGGFVGLGSKISTAFGGFVNTSGGSGGAGGGNVGGAGGRGRVRYDGFPTGAPNSAGSAGSTYNGPATDTLTYTDTRRITIRGSYNGTDEIRLYFRGDNTDWTLAPAPTYAGNTWSVTLTLPAVAGNYYFSALQKVNNPSSGTFDAKPAWVMSQVSANIVKLDLIAKINGDNALTFNRNIICEPELLDSFRIWNEGDDTLRVTPVLSSPDFSLLPPHNAPFKVAPGDTVRIKVRFTPTSSASKSTTMVLQNNDPRVIAGRPRNPWNVNLTATKIRIDVTLNPGRSLDFGSRCIGRDSTLSLIFNYQGDVAGSLKSITRLGGGSSPFTIDAPAAGSLPQAIAAPGGNVTITVRFSPTVAGTFLDSFRVVAGPCDTPLTFTVRGLALEGKAAVTPDPLDFGDVRVNTPKTLPITVRNTGASLISIASAYFLPAEPTLTGPTLPFGQSIAPGGAVTGDVTFLPTAAGPVATQLCIVLGGPCPDTICIDVTGRGVTSLLVLSRKQITMNADSCADPAPTVTDTFKLYNRGGAAETITGVSAVNGRVTVVSTPAIPPATDLAINDSILYTITWTPGATGVLTDQITITTNSVDPSQRTLTVDLTLRRQLSRYELLAKNGTPLPALMEFKDVYQCTGAQFDTLLLRNTGTMEELITGSFANGSVFNLQLIPPYRIAAGGALSLTIIFNPSTPGVYHDTLVLRNRACNREIRVPITGSRFELTFDLRGIDFGSSNVSTAKSGTATFTNTSVTPNNRRIQIVSVFLRQTGSAFAITRASLPTGIAPGEVASVDVSFTPPAQGNFSGELCFVLGDPCAQTVCVPLTGKGIQSNLIVRQSTLNFGTLYVCEDSTLSLIIENTGTAPIGITGLAITAGDVEAFEQVTQRTTPYSLGPGTADTLVFRFVPGRSTTNGLKTATFQITTDDPQIGSVTVTLLGERRKQALATPTALNFGTVDVGGFSEQDLILENRTAEPLTIDRFILPPPFTIVSPIPPLTIPAFSNVIIRVRFTPADSSQVTAELLAIHSSPCPDTTRIPVTGKGKIVQAGIADIAVPDTVRGEPGDKISIPILLERSQLLAESEATTFRAVIRFNKNLLYPTGARAKGEPRTTKVVTGMATTVGSIVSSTIQNNDRVVMLEITNTTMPTAPDTLGFLDVTVLLGDSISTPITIDTLFWTDGDVTGTTSNGLFVLDGYCQVGTDRLIRNDGAAGIKLVTPNPLNPSAEIIFMTSENGPTTLQIFDGRGSLVATLADREELPTGAHSRIWDATSHASGVYYAILTTPTERSTVQLVVVK